MNPKLEKLKKVMEIMKEGTVTPKELESFVSHVLKFVIKEKEEISKMSSEKMDEHSKHMEEMCDEIEDKLETISQDIKQDTQDKLSEIKAIIATIRTYSDGIDGKDGRDGKDGVDGKDGKDGSPDTPDQIVEKLNTLEEVIDQKVIKGLTKKISDISSNIAHGVGAKLYTGVSETRVRELIDTIPSSANTLADISVNSTTAPTSIYQMTSTIPIEFRSSSAVTVLKLDETNSRSLFSSGLVGTPGIGFNSDPDTGIWLSADATLDITVAGTTRAQFTTAGMNMAFSQSPIILNTNAATTTPNLIPNRTDQNTGIGWTSADVLSLIAGGVNGLNVKTSGGVASVGIGTIAPTRNLTVNNASSAAILGFARADTEMAYVGVDTTGAYISTSAANQIFRFYRNNGATETMRIDASGNVGIGVSPTHRIDAYISSSSTGVSTIYGLRDIPSGTISSGSSINGVFGQVTVSGSSTISNVIPTAGRFIAEHDGSSTVGGVYGVYAHARTNAASTGVLANAYSLYAVAPNNNQVGNTITNAYSLYIESPTAGATLNYGLYQTGSANNYFGGKVGIGTTSPSALVHALSTTEQLRLGYDVSNYASFTVNSGGDLTIAPTGGDVIFSDKVYSTSTSTGSYFDNTGFTILSGSAKFNAEDDMLFTIDYNNNDSDTRSFQWGKNSAASPTELMRLTEAGNLGIGVTAPTAVLHLKAGTATASTAPLKFTSGTNLTTAEAGAMEYNGTNLFFTRTGTTRETVNTTVTKTDTGDGTGAEGLFQINTFDNTFKVYAEGAWRTLATW